MVEAEVIRFWIHLEAESTGSMKGLEVDHEKKKSQVTPKYLTQTTFYNDLMGSFLSHTFI